MDQSSCVLLEAFRQFMDTSGVAAPVAQEEHEDQLEAKSTASSARAKQMLKKLWQHRKGTAKKTKAPVKVPTPSASVVTPLSPAFISMIYNATQGQLLSNKLSIYTQNLKTITKGTEYFSIDTDHALTALKSTLDRTGSISAILTASGVVELRDVLGVKYLISTGSQQQLVEFALGDAQAADGGELTGQLNDVQLFFGNLPT